MKILPVKFYERDTLKVAKELLGKIIVKGGTAGIIVETEAYKKDGASHASKRTPRSEIMFGPPGRAYVYFIYGNYYCLNFVTEKNGIPGAVLIRAVEPIKGINIMKRRRKCDDIRNLTSGPGKLCQAFGITKEHNGTSLINGPIKVLDNKMKFEIGVSKRIGISGKDADLPWRFYIKGNEFVSKRKI